MKETSCRYEAGMLSVRALASRSRPFSEYCIALKSPSVPWGRTGNGGVGCESQQCSQNPRWPGARPDATGCNDLEAFVVAVVVAFTFQPSFVPPSRRTFAATVDVVEAVVVTEAAASQETMESSENSREFFLVFC